MRRFIALAAILAFMVGALPAFAGSPPSALDRLSFGVDAEGASWSGTVENESSFLPGAYLSFGATSGLSFSATLKRDFPRHTTFGTGGFAFKIMSSDRGQIGLGANVAAYGDQVAWLGVKKPTSWNAVVNGSYDLVQNHTTGQTIIYGIAGASLDPDNNVKQVHIGLRAQILGGRSY